jgi:hypothetical protein
MLGACAAHWVPAGTAAASSSGPPLPGFQEHFVRLGKIKTGVQLSYTRENPPIPGEEENLPPGVRRVNITKYAYHVLWRPDAFCYKRVNAWGDSTPIAGLPVSAYGRSADGVYWEVAQNSVRIFERIPVPQGEPPFEDPNFAPISVEMSILSLLNLGAGPLASATVQCSGVRFQARNLKGEPCQGRLSWDESGRVIGLVVTNRVTTVVNHVRYDYLGVIGEQVPDRFTVSWGTSGSEPSLVGTFTLTEWRVLSEPPSDDSFMPQVLYPGLAVLRYSDEGVMRKGSAGGDWQKVAPLPHRYDRRPSVAPYVIGAFVLLTVGLLVFSRRSAKRQ